ncbi:helix-turn-helix domain-containing protein [Lachnoclostridium sp. An118]|uniref:helix-turn-helix domain-containing protein n=1 Tax=Lachnoclostridium sp. An118 TaxID=1965547 RepID=UPI001FA8A187|nr:helix-turn-helix transcriptional regulator [Lachnoclostridium sp. An118]
MYQIDNEKFGQFLSDLRKEKSMTQKELADRLFVSDKTVSKWERGNSMPNVTLLIPIADVLGITVTALS